MTFPSLTGGVVLFEISNPISPGVLTLTLVLIAAIVLPAVWSKNPDRRAAALDLVRALLPHKRRRRNGPR